MDCKACGARLTVGMKVCPECQTPMDEVASRTPYISELHETDRDRATIPFRLLESEVVKAVYPLTRVQRRAGTLVAHLFVTDARVVYRAEAKNRFNASTVSQEIQLGDICGFSVTRRTGLPLMGAVAAVALALSAIPMLLSVVLIPLLIIGILVIFAFKRFSEFTFVIQARQMGAAPIVLSNSGLSGWLADMVSFATYPFKWILARFGILDAAEAFGPPTPEARQMFEEIGALVMDLQGRGVLGAGQS